MSPREVHYRLALGEYDDEPSYIVQSKKGIAWRNLPPTLDSLLKSLNTDDVIDFSLGEWGRWYIKYRQRGVERRKLSNGLWNVIGQDPNHHIERLSLGSNGAFWGVIRIPNVGLEEFGYRAPRLHKLFNYTNYQSLLQNPSNHITLGCNGAFAVPQWDGMRVNGVRRDLIAAIETAQARTTVESVFLSPYHPEYWMLVLEDGTVDYSLPQYILNAVLPYCKPRFSLCTPQSPPKRMVHSAVSAWTSRAFREIAPSTTVQQVYDPAESSRVRKLFYDGWQHPHKQPLPYIHEIYTIAPPHNITSRYSTYRTLVESRNRYTGPIERLLFHGTRRGCGIGDSSSSPCHGGECNLCMILRSSFKVDRAGTAPGRNFLRFGTGIYTTSVSSKADDYTLNAYYSEKKVMLVAKVITGNVHRIWRTDQSITAPPYPYDSVAGEVGVDLNYDEQVVYRDDAIIPAYLVVYSAEEDSSSDW